MAFKISHYDTISGDFFIIIMALALAAILDEFHGQNTLEDTEKNGMQE